MCYKTFQEQREGERQKFDEALAGRVSHSCEQ